MKIIFKYYVHAVCNIYNVVLRQIMIFASIHKHDEHLWAEGKVELYAATSYAQISVRPTIDIIMFSNWIVRGPKRAPRFIDEHYRFQVRRDYCGDFSCPFDEVRVVKRLNCFGLHGGAPISYSHLVCHKVKYSLRCLLHVNSPFFCAQKLRSHKKHEKVSVISAQTGQFFILNYMSTCLCKSGF